jgi:GlpG protein
MRQLATLPAEDQARAFADYLLTLRIETRLDPEPGGWAVWVCDEDRVAQARAELEQFTRNPSDPRYSRAGREAGALRRQEDQAERAYARRQVAMRDRFDDAAAPRFHPLTFLLIAACVVVALLTKGGEDRYSPAFQALVIVPYSPVPGNLILPDRTNPFEGGQFWRLVTPIFLHFGLIHLVFNLLMLHSLGGLVEARRGPRRFLLLVLVLAVLSNLAQYYHPVVVAGGTPRFKSDPQFGGMSGVLYGLFGYAWMKARYEPQLGLTMAPSTVFIMIAWFILCLTGLVGAIANWAHAAGLAVGLLIGIAPHLWRSLRGRA